jgi:hypothetical protein
MTIKEFNEEKEACAKILNYICELECNHDDVKGLYLKLFDMYLKKELGWRHTDDFKEIIKQL